ncbi:MAG: NAD(P)/FAD-dependent oxidoreductase [Pseudonocardiaceae bacterium]|nr:NAD(P)/FAD-dependent oxidoreductase [Pseudonocardiaceae bacterium]
MSVVIIGNGMAGHRLAQGLRRRSPDLAVTVLGAEPQPAYNRVLLSGVLAGTSSAAAVELADPGVDVRLGAQVVGIDTRQRRVQLAEGPDVGYDELVLATGSRAAIPPVDGLADPDGSPAPGVVAFRTLADCEHITELARGGPMAVVGGGLLGVEAARGLAGLGVDVTVVHPVGHLMERQLDPGGGEVLAGVLGGLGVRMRFGVSAESWRPGRLTLSDGSALDVAGVVVSAGVAPQSWLARRAGLRVDRGIVVDDRMATSVPGVHAIGECAEHRGSCHGLVGPCWEQADVLADLLSGVDPGARYTGSALVTRLKARDVDLAAMGELPGGAPGDTGDTAEVVRVSDATRGRYGALTLRDGRICGAVLLGFPEAAGPVIQLYDSGGAVPDDRFGLLLGRAAGTVTDSPAQLPARAVVCKCNGVTKREIVGAWRDGARDTAAIATATRATTGCGSCADTVDGLCGWLTESDPGPEELPVAAAREGAA